MNGALLVLAVAVLAGLYGAKGARRFKTPQVVGYVIAGVVVGPSILGLLKKSDIAQMDLVSEVALGIIGFIVGSELSLKKVKEVGKAICYIVCLEAMGALLLVLAGTYLLTRDMPLALILGALAAATAPAGTVDVLQEYKARGRLTTILYAVVGLDDAISVIAFGFCLPLAIAILSGTHHFSVMQVLMEPLKEISLSVVLGAAVGLSLTVLSRHMRTPPEQMVLALGSVLLCCGLAVRWHLSLILANMTSAFLFVNLDPHRCGRASHELSMFATPIYVIFFVLVGARLDVSLLPKMGVLGLCYVALRTLGKWSGAYSGARLARADEKVRKYIGLGLFSQAGVAIGLALMTHHELNKIGTAAASHLGAKIIMLITATTLVVQIIGPPFLKYAIVKSGEAGKLPDGS